MLGIARGQMLEDRSRRIVAVDFEKSRSAIGHRQRAAIERGGWSEEVKTCELMDAREFAVGSLVCRSDYSFRGRDAIELTPRIACHDAVYTIPPRVVRNVSRRRCFRLLGEREDVGDGALTECPQIWLDLLEHRFRQPPLQIGAQKGVGVVLVTQLRRL